MSNATYVERIKQLREEDGISQTQLGKKIGYSQSAINLWEIGARVPNAIAVIKLADYFGVTTDYLLGRTDKLD